MLHPPAEFPFWVNSSIRSTPPWVTCSDKPSCRHTICCGIVGLALAWGEIAKFTTLFAHPQLAPATTKNHTPCCPLRHVVGRISVRCKTRLQVPESRVGARA